VEVDTFYTGSSPKKHTKWYKYVHVPPGKGAGKTIVMVAKSRKGAARATILPGESEKEIKLVVAESVDEHATLMSDSDKGLKAAGKDFAGHQAVNHSAKEYVRGNVHANTVEALGGILHRAVFGVHHHLSPEHLQRYLDELGFRWTHRWIEKKVGRSGTLVSQMKTAHFEIQLEKLLCHAVGRELRYSAIGGVQKPGATKPHGAPRGRPKSPPNPDEIPF
jgi:ISXO2-like transposase domain